MPDPMRPAMDDLAEGADRSVGRDRFKRDRAADEASHARPQRSAFLNPNAQRPLPQSFGPPPTSRLFQSWFIGGFECSTHRRRDGRRLDLLASTCHDVNVAADYRMLADRGIRTVRDGVRWHLIETSPGHYGWPDDIDVWSPAFVDRFAAFARALARVV